MELIEYARSNYEGQGPEAADFINNVIAAFKENNCTSHFKNLSSHKQASQKAIVRQFQTGLKNKLDKIPNTWKDEFRVSELSKDCVDLFAKVTLDSIEYSVIIELDKSRADQVSKKFISRTSHSINDATIYFAFCYPGTRSMSLNECKKFLSYCQNLSAKLHNSILPRHFIGLIVE